MAIFLACQTQWRTGPAKVIGLDYAGVEVVIARRAMEVTPETFEGLQVMEYAVLEAWNSADH